MNIQDFISEVQRIHKTGAATEHSYRPALQVLLSSIREEVEALNEPKRVKCGAPDFLMSRNGIVIGHVEAKDIDKNLRSLKGTDAEQKKRYLQALPNLVYTNCLDFEFYRGGELLKRITIANLSKGIQPKPENYSQLENQLKDFVAQRPQTITSSEKLAEIMAGKAVLIKDVLFNALREDKDQETALAGQYQAFKEHLIHDITTEDFSDIYAETVAYGMFAARLHDETIETFSRAEALELLPKSNPFLRALFAYVAGPNLDERIRWIIDDLADIFQAANVKKIMDDFGSLTGRSDPFLHFYETFLAKYNPAKRKARGVWYTPEPVVNFIVRAVDEVLKTEFGLSSGLADTSKVTVKWETGQRARTKKGGFKKSGESGFITKEVHRVQILDPATGTGTFLAEVIKQIAPKVKGLAPGAWSNYVEQDLIPRLHGFELLMASYAMCHMKLDMVLSELGYKPSAKPPRLSVYLTNSLEEGEPANQTLPFAQWLSNEVKEAHAIKRDMPIMVVIGNPPYSGHSSNKGTWIKGLLEDYKTSPELKKPAQAKWLSDDYVKFIRLAEYMIDKNGYGVLGFITNSSYLDNPTFLDMRKHLMKTFDSIHVFDLHGSAKKGEAPPSGEQDQNVFDIQQGVSVIIAAKKDQPSKAGEDARVFHADVWGTRQSKYEWLWSTALGEANKTDVTPTFPPWLFTPQDQEVLAAYQEFPSVADWFSPYGRPAPGAVSTQDQFAVSWSKDEIGRKIKLLLESSSEEDARRHFRLCTQKQWHYEKAKLHLAAVDWSKDIIEIDYRLFDRRFTVNDSHVFVHRRERMNHHMLSGENIGLVTCRQTSTSSWNHAFVGSRMVDDCFLSNKTKERTYCFPLYLEPEETSLDQRRETNLDAELFKRISELAQGASYGKPEEQDVFNYIYGVLYCPTYREKYQDLLKRDFPRIPWPKGPSEFWETSEKGRQLRHLHLMEPAAIGDTFYPFCGEGNAQVEKPICKKGRAWINKTQYFDEVPEVAWSFRIGGYQPAKKWLKDRKGRKLSFDDITHYQKIIKVLVETDRIMKTIKCVD